MSASCARLYAVVWQFMGMLTPADGIDAWLLLRVRVVGEEVPNDQTRAVACQRQIPKHCSPGRGNLHFMVVPSNPKRETAVDNVLDLIARALERARGKQRVVGRVERDGSKLLPVPHVRLFRQDLVEGDFPLPAGQHSSNICKIHRYHSPPSNPPPAP